MYIYRALTNALSAHMIHINLNMILYTHVEHRICVAKVYLSVYHVQVYSGHRISAEHPSYFAYNKSSWVRWRRHTRETRLYQQCSCNKNYPVFSCSLPLEVFAKPPCWRPRPWLPETSSQNYHNLYFQGSFDTENGLKSSKLDKSFPGADRVMTLLAFWSLSTGGVRRQLLHMPTGTCGPHVVDTLVTRLFSLCGENILSSKPFGSENGGGGGRGGGGELGRSVGGGGERFTYFSFLLSMTT